MRDEINELVTSLNLSLFLEGLYWQWLNGGLNGITACVIGSQIDQVLVIDRGMNCFILITWLNGWVCSIARLGPRSMLALRTYLYYRALQYPCYFKSAFHHICLEMLVELD